MRPIIYWKFYFLLLLLFASFHYDLRQLILVADIMHLNISIDVSVRSVRCIIHWKSLLSGKFDNYFLAVSSHFTKHLRLLHTHRQIDKLTNLEVNFLSNIFWHFHSYGHWCAKPSKKCDFYIFECSKNGLELIASIHCSFIWMSVDCINHCNTSYQRIFFKKATKLRLLNCRKSSRVML